MNTEAYFCRVLLPQADKLNPRFPRVWRLPLTHFMSEQVFSNSKPMPRSSQKESVASWRMGGMRGFAGFLFARLFSSVNGTDPGNNATNVSSPGTPTRGMWPRVQGQANVGSRPRSAAFGGCSHQEEDSPLGQHRDPPSPPGPHLSELHLGIRCLRQTEALSTPARGSPGSLYSSALRLHL